MANAPAPPIARRRIRAAVRATPDEGPGTFEALVSDYSATYDIGWGWTERIMPGCFADSIAEHPAIPVCWNHDWKAGPIGHGTAQELDLGLIVRGELYLDLDGTVQRIYRAMQAKAVEEWSIAFFPERIVNDEDDPYCDLIERGDLIEATSCFRGANPGTETIDLRGAPLVRVEGDAQAEVVRLRKLFSVPEIPALAIRDKAATFSGATTSTNTGTTIPGAMSVVVNGIEYHSATASGDGNAPPPPATRGADARRNDAGSDPAGAAPPSDTEPVATPEGGDGDAAGEPGVAASPELLGRLLATRAGRDAMRVLVGSASSASSSATNGSTPT